MREEKGIILIDVQERLFGPIAEKEAFISRLTFFLKASSVLSIPLIVTEQNPLKMGETVSSLREIFSERNITPFAKMSFSLWKEPAIRTYMQQSPIVEWVLVGIETPICVLLSALDLKSQGKEVTVLWDATAARSLKMHEQALLELQRSEVRVTHSETWIYEYLQRADHPRFPEVLQLVKHHGM